MTTPSRSPGQDSTVEIVESLNNINARITKPIELMLSSINVLMDEPGCRAAGMVLRNLTGPDESRQIPDGADALAAAWSRHPGIGEALTELRAAVATRTTGATVGTNVNPRWLLLAVSGFGLLGLLFGVFGITDNTFRIAVGAFAVALIIVPLVAILFDWGYRRNKEAARQAKEAADRALELAALQTDVGTARMNLSDAIRNALNMELSGGLPGTSTNITYSSWYIRYPLTADSSRFSHFLDNPEATLCDLIETYDLGEEATIQSKFKAMVGNRILASNWANSDYPKNLVLIPIGNGNNLEKFGVTAVDLPTITGLEEPIFQPAVGMDYQLSCLYIIMRSPVGESDLANHELYVKAAARASQEELNRRDPEPGTEPVATLDQP